MTLPELQACMDRLGIKLSLRLVIDAPAGVMTEEVMAALADHKPRLLAMLGGESPAPWPPRSAELASWQIAWREKWGRGWPTRCRTKASPGRSTSDGRSIASRPRWRHHDAGVINHI